MKTMNGVEIERGMPVRQVKHNGLGSPGPLVVQDMNTERNEVIIGHGLDAPALTDLHERVRAFKPDELLTA